MLQQTVKVLNRKMNISQEKLWEMLLLLRLKVKNNPEDLSNVIILWDGEELKLMINTFEEIPHHYCAVIFSKDPWFIKSGQVLFSLDETYRTTLIQNKWFNSHQLEFLQLYLPLCFCGAKAYCLKRTVSALHMAQTLDGRIATKNGNSKWIGNQDNLIHSHRMRALCDAILIGTRTLKVDKPALSVRHVNGPTPLKVVVGNSACNFDSLLENNGKVLFFTSSNDYTVKGIENIHIPGDTSIVSPSVMLKELFKRGVYSIYIEGGSMTASTFLVDKSIDILQLFLAPKIFGSGICDFVLPSISNVDESVEFINGSFKPMGDGILFEGEVCYKGEKYDL